MNFLFVGKCSASNSHYFRTFETGSLFLPPFIRLFHHICKNGLLLKRWFNSQVCKRILPTPFSLGSFAVDSAEIEEEAMLKEEIMRKAQETTMAFATEIKDMSHDKLLFLSHFQWASAMVATWAQRNYEYESASLYNYAILSVSNSSIYTIHVAPLWRTSIYQRGRAKLKLVTI